MSEKQFSSLWKELIESGRKIEHGVTHQMTGEQLFKIKTSIDYLIPQGVPNPLAFNHQFDFDMGLAKYKLYDALGMAMGGRWGEDADTLNWVTKLAKSYVGCVKEDGVTTPNDLYDCIDKRIYKED